MGIALAFILLVVFLQAQLLAHEGPASFSFRKTSLEGPADSLVHTWDGGIYSPVFAHGGTSMAALACLCSEAPASVQCPFVECSPSFAVMH